MKVLELQTETEKELAAVAAELAIENRKLRIALNAANKLGKDSFEYSTKLPVIDPMAVDVRSVV